MVANNRTDMLLDSAGIIRAVACEAAELPKKDWDEALVPVCGLIENLFSVLLLFGLRSSAAAQRSELNFDGLWPAPQCKI